MAHSLDSLLQRHASVLVLDCASAEIQVGCVGRAGAFWSTALKPAGEGLLGCVGEALEAAGETLASVGAFALNEGPGSILGIRTVAVSLRAWNAIHPKPIYGFSGLIAFALAEARSGRALPFSAIADARRDTWHRVCVATLDSLPGLVRVPDSELSGACVLPQGYRTWSKPPETSSTVPYSLRAHFAAVGDLPLFHVVTEPDAFLHEDPSYKPWEATIHRAPTS